MRRKIICSVFILFFIISINIIKYCKYTYIFEKNIIKLTRDAISPKCTVSYSSEEWTNDNIIITIEADKEIEQSSGFELSEDKRTLKKIAYVNESDTVIVKDLFGNSTEVAYSVSNIDKGQPMIIGVENNKKYKAPVKLDFWDDSEIENITIDRYNDKLKIDYHSEFLDSAIFKNIDRNVNTITIHVKEHPLNTKFYKYYLNGKLYMTSNGTNYTYTGLKKGTEYKVKVEALDQNGNILDKEELLAKTSYFEIIFAQKTDKSFSANIQNLDKEVKKFKYSVNNFYNPNSIEWYEPEFNKDLYIKCERANSQLYPSYMINVYLYDRNDIILDIVQFLIDFNENYKEVELSEESEEYELNIPGNYQIKVADIAGNETEYYIKVY